MTDGFAKKPAFEDYEMPRLGFTESAPINPLSIASIEDIVEELKSRYDGMVIGVMVRSEKSNKSRVRQWYRGDYFTTLGMLHFMIAGQEADEDDGPDTWDGEE